MDPVSISPWQRISDSDYVQAAQAIHGHKSSITAVPTLPTGQPCGDMLQLMLFACVGEWVVFRLKNSWSISGKVVKLTASEVQVRAARVWSRRVPQQHVAIVHIRLIAIDEAVLPAGLQPGMAVTAAVRTQLKSSNSKSARGSAAHGSAPQALPRAQGV